MKHIVSVSLGSSRRNHRVELKLLGQHLLIERIGTDGNLRQAEELLRKLDGEVDVLSLGGVNRYLFVGDRQYSLRDDLRLAAVVKRTPLVDGGGIKQTWEKHLVSHLQNRLGWPQKDQTVLFSSVLDRWPLAEAFSSAGCRLIIGDALFALGLPLPFYCLKTFSLVARFTLPALRLLPITMLYPTGKKQEESRSRFTGIYQKADILAGDFHFLRRHLPDRLEGKRVITSTITSQDQKELANRGVRWLVTSAPEIGGRWFGANVLEAVCIALLNRPPKEIHPGLYPSILQQAALTPGCYQLN